MRRLAALAAALGVGAIALVGCVPPAPDPPPVLTPIATMRNRAVGTTQYTVTDSRRGTPALGGYPGSGVRTIPLSVWYPADAAPGTLGAGLAPDKANGPYPLVIFAHGYSVTPGDYGQLLSRVASAGYVVVAPTYPILSGQPAGPSDTVDWEAKFDDTKFTISSALQLSAGNDAVLGGMIDPQRIAVAGHSDGALISFSAGFVAWRLDARVRAVVSYAALLGEPGTIYQPNGRALLHFASDADAYNSFGATVAWDHANLSAPAWTVGLWNASHGEPYMDPNDAHFGVVVNATIDFLDFQLKAQSSLGLFLDITTNPGLAAFV